MPELEDPREERFVHNLALGKKICDAFTLAGYEAQKPRYAYALTKKPHIKARLAELLAGFREECGVTMEELTAKLRHAWSTAVDKEDVPGQIAASMGLAKLHGYLVDKSVNLHGDISKLASLPRDDLERLHRLLSDRQAERLIGTSGQAAIADQTIQLQAVSQAKGVSQGGGDTPREIIFGSESGWQNSRGGDGMGDAPDGEVPGVVGGEKVREAG